MDNIRNVIGCPVAGLTAHELFDASPIARAFTDAFLRNKAFTNLPRKFNVGITGCTEHCTHGGDTGSRADAGDGRAAPARKSQGFNVAVGGKGGIGRLPRGVAARRLRAAGRRRGAVQPDHVHLSRSRFARDADEGAPRLPDRGVGRAEIPGGARAPDGPARCRPPARTGAARGPPITWASSNRNSPG